MSKSPELETLVVNLQSGDLVYFNDSIQIVDSNSSLSVNTDAYKIELHCLIRFVSGFSVILPRDLPVECLRYCGSLPSDLMRD